MCVFGFSTDREFADLAGNCERSGLSLPVIQHHNFIFN